MIVRIGKQWTTGKELRQDRMEFVDNEGRKIYLSDKQRRHIGYHMHLHDKLHRIEETLRTPTIVRADSEQGKVWYFQKYLKKEGVYFIVVVKIQNGDGFIITIYKSRKEKQ